MQGENTCLKTLHFCFHEGPHYFLFSYRFYVCSTHDPRTLALLLKANIMLQWQPLPAFISFFFCMCQNSENEWKHRTVCPFLWVEGSWLYLLLKGDSNEAASDFSQLTQWFQQKRNVLLPKCLVHFVLSFCTHLCTLRDTSELSRPLIPWRNLSRKLITKTALHPTRVSPFLSA